MRKLAFLSVLLFNGFSFGGAWAADCELINKCSAANEYLTIPGTAGCYECDKSRCPNGTVISATRATLEGKTYTDTMFTCHVENGGDLWRTSDVPDCTKARYLTVKNDDNAHRVMINPDSGEPVIVNNGGAIAVVGVEACMGYECDTGYTEVNGKCVKPNNNCVAGGSTKMIGEIVDSQPDCRAAKMDTPLNSTEHLVADAVCDATCAANGWNITLRSNSCESGYEPDAAKKKCVLTEAARREGDRRDRDRRENASKKEKCESTGGVWSANKCSCDGAKNLKLESGECKCLDDVNYKRSADGKSCDLTDAAALQRKCESAAVSGAIWDGKKCSCTDSFKIWNGTTCIENPDKTRCESISGAKWSDGQCVCIDSDKEMNADNTACVETAAARNNREQATSKANIESIVGKINTLKSGLSTSVWKNKDGNFNTSRLVSDSVAGVVLGTAGGLITSNVIKKNQIKGGFEDISCTVRGQVVAGYGDEFQVGIQ